MIDFTTPNEALPTWHWHSAAKDGPDGTGQLSSVDSGNWTAESAWHVAHFIGWQMAEFGYSGWTVDLWLGHCSDGEHTLTYSQDDHTAWVFAVPSDDEEIIAIKAALASPPESDKVHYVEFPELMRRIAGAAKGDWARGADPIAHLDHENGVSGALKFFEAFMGNDGSTDLDKLIRMTGQTLMEAVGAIILHNKAAHSGQPWTECPESVNAMAGVSSVFAGAVLAQRIGS